MSRDVEGVEDVTEPHRLEWIKDILQRAVELPLAERERFVQRACRGDEQVHREVVSLLAHERDRPPWAEGPLLALAVRQPTEAAPDSPLPGQRIGPYRVE